jgi:uncharacterized protein with PIN domain
MRRPTHPKGYINWTPKDRCPECGQSGAQMLRSVGPHRVSDEDNWPCRAVSDLFRCGGCGTEYWVDELVE